MHLMAAVACFWNSEEELKHIAWQSYQNDLLGIVGFSQPKQVQESSCVWVCSPSSIPSSIDDLQNNLPKQKSCSTTSKSTPDGAPNPDCC